MTTYRFLLSHPKVGSPTHFLQCQLDWLVGKGQYLNRKTFRPLHPGPSITANKRCKE